MSVYHRAPQIQEHPKKTSNNPTICNQQHSEWIGSRNGRLRLQTKSRYTINKKFCLAVRHHRPSTSYPDAPRPCSRRDPGRHALLLGGRPSLPVRARTSAPPGLPATSALRCVDHWALRIHWRSIPKTKTWSLNDLRGGTSAFEGVTCTPTKLVQLTLWNTTPQSTLSVI